MRSTLAHQLVRRMGGAKVWMMLCGFLLCTAQLAWAHKGSDAYLDIHSDASVPHVVTLRWSVALKDIDVALPLDANADGKVTWGEVKQRTPEILAWMQDSFSLQVATSDNGTNRGGAACALTWRFETLERRSDGAYFQALARMQPADTSVATTQEGALAADCLSTAKGWQLDYHLLQGIDDTHRLLVGASVQGQDSLYVLAPGQSLALSSGAVAKAAQGAADDANTGNALTYRNRVWATFKQYVYLGLTHLLTGYDHMAFLLALVLPLQLAWCWLGQRPQYGTRQGMPAFLGQPSTVAGANPAYTGAAGWRLMLTTVTAFTLGHSVTLILATLGWVDAPSNWVEPIIALSIGVSAWLNFYRHHPVRPDVLALCFGLIHGLGFAGLLQEMQAPAGLLPWALAGFNLGVEVGQLMAVVLWVVVIQTIVRRSWYHSVVVRGGSVALILLSGYWVAQRVGLV